MAFCASGLNQFFYEMTAQLGNFGRNRANLGGIASGIFLFKKGLIQLCCSGIICHQTWRQVSKERSQKGVKSKMCLH